MAALCLLMLVQDFALVVNSLTQKEDFSFDLSPAVCSKIKAFLSQTVDY